MLQQSLTWLLLVLTTPVDSAKLYTICCNMIQQYCYFTNPVLSCVVPFLLFLFRCLNYLLLLVWFAVFCSKACDVHPLHVTLFACCSKMPCVKSLINLLSYLGLLYILSRSRSITKGLFTWRKLSLGRGLSYPPS